MKLSSDTIAILKNYSEINPNLTINPGNRLKTISESQTIYSCGQVEEVFEHKFGIYDLKEFLATLSMFKDPDLTFTDKYVDIIDVQDNSIRTRYWSANLETLTKTPDMPDQLPPCEVTFTISSLNFKRIERACNTLKFTDVKFVGKDRKIIAVVFDASESVKNTFTVELESDFDGEDFEVQVDQKKLVMIDGDYQCNLLNGRTFQCVHKEKNLQYFIALSCSN